MEYFQNTLQQPMSFYDKDDNSSGSLMGRLTTDPKQLQEIVGMNELKKKDHQDRNLTYDGNFYYWDRDYYNNIIVETQYAVDQVKVSEYFPLDRTLTAMLGIFESLFSMHFVQLSDADLAALSPSSNAEEMTWHEDVIAFAVWEGDGSGFVGYLYMDL